MNRLGGAAKTVLSKVSEDESWAKRTEKRRALGTRFFGNLFLRGSPDRTFSGINKRNLLRGEAKPTEWRCLRTPFLGGFSSSGFALTAFFFAPPQPLGVLSEDFPEGFQSCNCSHIKTLQSSDPHSSLQKIMRMLRLRREGCTRMLHS